MLTGNADRMRRRVDVDVAMEKGISLRYRILPPEQGPHAGDQLAHAERLGDIVIGAKLKSNNPVGFFAPRREHKNRNPGVPFISTKLPADLQSIHSGPV